MRYSKGREFNGQAAKQNKNQARGEVAALGVGGTLWQLCPARGAEEMFESIRGGSGGDKTGLHQE